MNQVHAVNGVLESLRTKYDTEAIADIEKIAQTNLDSALNQRREFIETLYYLERTGRYRENPRYAESSFGAYIKSMYLLTVSKYDNERVAFIKYPRETEVLGLGTVNKVATRCGPLKAAKAFEKISQAKKKGPRPLKNAQIEEIIEVHARQPEKKKHTVILPKSELYRELAQLKMKLAEKEAKIKEMHDQIKRLKTTVEKLKAPAKTKPAPNRKIFKTE